MTDYLTALDEDALTAAGVPGWPYGYGDKVRFYELDKLDQGGADEEEIRKRMQGLGYIS